MVEQRSQFANRVVMQPDETMFVLDMTAGVSVCCLDVDQDCLRVLSVDNLEVAINAWNQ